MFSFKSSTSEQSFTRTPSCQICLSPYDGSRHTPKILQCAHTICEQCINVLEEQGRRTTANRNLDRSFVSITCPTCRVTTQTPRNCIRKNYQLIEVVDDMLSRANHNVEYVTCVECNGVYHEKDVNICTKCSPIKSNTCVLELIPQKISLSAFALCSTCLLSSHIRLGHMFLLLQPLRIEMQRQENLNRILQIEENLNRMRGSFRERLNETMEKWISWSSNHDTNMKRFLDATDSFNQKRLYDEFVKQLTKKTERIENLMKSVQKWSDELEAEAQAVPANPAVAPEDPIRANTPIEHPLGADYLYYFEQ